MISLVKIIVIQIAYTSAYQLRFVTVVHRHGDRIAALPYPKNETLVPIFKNENFGQLTDLGENQMYNLGKHIRDRYPQFRFNEFNKNDLYVESSEVDRTELSANLVLAGLFRSNKTTRSSSEKQHIPIHIIPFTDDNKILNRAPCRKLRKLEEHMIEKEISLCLQQKYDALLKDLSEYSGLGFNYSLTGLEAAGLVGDTLSIQDSNGLKLPDWTVKFYPVPLKGILSFSFSLPYTTKEMKRLRCGPLMKEMIGNFDDVVSGKSKLKMWLYSGHDSTIADVLSCLNLYDYRRPLVASAVFLDLYEDENKNFYVMISYERGGDEKTLKIPGCLKSCPLDRFKELLTDIIPGDWKAECNS